MTQEKFLILICGLPGTGKTVICRLLQKSLPGYKAIEQNEIRRKQGMKRMPKSQDEVLRKIDRMTAEYLRKGKGVIVDSVHRYEFRRNHLYGIASACGVRVLVLEVVCDDKTAKQRIRSRRPSDGLLSDPNNPKVHDRLKNLWENIAGDFLHPGQGHVSYIQFDSEQNKLTRIAVVRKEMKPFILTVKKILEREIRPA